MSIVAERIDHEEAKRIARSALAQDTWNSSAAAHRGLARAYLALREENDELARLAYESNEREKELEAALPATEPAQPEEEPGPAADYGTQPPEVP